MEESLARIASGFSLARKSDVAAALAIGAIAVGVRARVADEQPTALGLGET